MIRDALAGSEPVTRLPTEIQGLMMSGFLSARATPADRTGLRQLGTARLTGGWKAPDRSASVSADGTGAWSLLDADLVPEDPHLVLSGHRGAVTALATIRDPSGREQLVSAGRDGTVRLWDQAFAVRSDLAHVSGGILGLTVLTLHDGTHQLVCTAVRSPGLRRLDPHTGAEAATARTGPMGGFASFRDRAGVLRLAGIEGGGLTIRDALTLRRTKEALVGQRRPLTAIAALADADGLPLIANAASDGTIRLWDPRKGRAVFDPVRLQKVRALAAAPRPGAIDLVLAGHDDGSLTCWDPETRSVSTLPAATAPVVDMAVARLAAGRVLVVVGLTDGTVWARWLCLETADEPGGSQPAAGWRPGPMLLGHEGRVNCVVVMPSSRAPTGLVSVASGGDDGTVRLWEIEASAAFADGEDVTSAARPRTREPLAWPREWMLTAPAGGRLAVTADDDGQVTWACESAGEGRLKLPAGPAHCAAVLAGPGGEELLALADQEGVISSWSLPAGSPFGPVLRGHTDWVSALAVLIPQDGPEVLVSGGDDATVRFWRPDQSAALHVVPLDAPVVSLSVLGRDVQVGLTSGMVTIRLETGQLLVEKERTEHVR